MIRSLGPYCDFGKLYACGQILVNKLLSNRAEVSAESSVDSRYHSEALGSSTNTMTDTFKLTDYDCIGFDLDNTLLRYHVTNLVHMEYEELANYLVNQRGYSAAHLLRPLTDDDLDFMQKGLLLDFDRGNVLRVSPDGVIRRATHGSRLLSVDRIKEIYPDQRWDITDVYCKDILSAWNGPASKKIRGLMDYFDMPASIVFARLIDMLDEEHGSPLNSYNVWPDILDGLYHLFSKEQFQNFELGFFAHLKKDPEKYLRKCSAETIAWLRKLKERSTTFLLTGSNADFVNFAASYALGDNWRSLFDIVICFARKPGFFIGARPFLDVVDYNETNVKSQHLELGGIYSQGNWNDLSKFLSGVTKKANQRCLYVGDNLIQDIYAPNTYVHCDVLAVIEEQMSEGMLHHGLTHPDEKILNSKLWGSFFCLKDSTIKVNSLWRHILKNHAKLCIPEVNIIAQIPLEKPIPSFKKDGEVYSGYYPGIPLSISAM